MISMPLRGAGRARRMLDDIVIIYVYGIILYSRLMLPDGPTMRYRRRECYRLTPHLCTST